MYFAVCWICTKLHHRHPGLPISKLGGWQHTAAFNKSSETNRHQTLNHIRQYWCYGNQSLNGNRGGRWALRNRGELPCLQKAGKLPRRTRRRNTTLKRGARISAVLLRKRGNVPNGSVPPWGSKSNKRRLTSLDLESGSKPQRRLVNECLINGLPGLLAVKIIREQISLTNPLTRTPVHHLHQQAVAMTNSSRTQQT